MFKKFAFLLAVILVMGATLNNEPAVDISIRNKLSKKIEQLHIPGAAVEIIHNGKPNAYYLGYANTDKKTPITQHTIFHLGALTELMTSLLLAEQIDAAKMQLTSPVKQFLPNLTSDDFDDITVASLATHTAGLPLKPPSNVTTQNALYQYLNQWYPDAVVNQTWEQSHLGMGILADAIESVTRNKLAVLYKRDIFSTLGMKSTSLVINNKANEAQGYNAKGQPIIATRNEILSGAWELKASAGDMLKFLSAAIGMPGTPESILYPIRMTQAAFIELPQFKQGMGWQIYSLESEQLNALSSPHEQINVVQAHEIPAKAIYKPNALLEKASSYQGHSAYIALVPGKKTGIVILMNKSLSLEQLSEIGRELLLDMVNEQTAMPAQNNA